ncbi:hypothetical protein [Limosilactobacillus sp.]|uniref:hypothetical protein n=1 Tax=Limosilactobacillus sp. TaxID=2773925 RepID=UPI00345E62E2
MTDRRIDPRVVKTQRRLRRALVELLRVMPVKSISVQHITSRAMLPGEPFTCITVTKRILCPQL